MRRLLLPSSLFICLLSIAFFASAADQRIAAIVNDDVVSVQDLDDRLGLVLMTGRVEDEEVARNRLAPQVLRGLIEERLQLQEAARLSIEVSPEDIDRALADIAGRNKMSVDDMLGLLDRNDIDRNTMQEQLQAQISWLKLVNQLLRPQVDVTVDQLDIAVEEAESNQGQPEYLLSEIVLPVDNPNQEQQVASDAARLVQTLSEGASFEGLARQVSASASATRGGDVGWVSSSAIPEELVRELERLRPGDVSEPLRSPVGFFIFQLRDRRLTKGPAGEGAEVTPLEVRLSQILFQADTTDDQLVAATVDEAAGLRDRLDSCEAVNTVAAELEAEASGDLGWVQVGDLPTVLSSAIDDLETGEISVPLRGPGGVHLLMVCDRRGGERPVAAELSEEERGEIEGQLRRERLDRLARRYLRDLRKQAFIDIRI